MERHTFIGRMIETFIGLFIGNFDKWVRKIANNVPHKIQEVLLYVINVVENMKEISEAPIVDFLTEIIPGHWDDDLVEQFRKALTKILELDLVKTIEIDTAPDNLHAIAANLTKELTGMSFGQSAITIEAAYQKYKADKVQDVPSELLEG